MTISSLPRSRRPLNPKWWRRSGFFSDSLLTFLFFVLLFGLGLSVGLAGSSERLSPRSPSGQKILVVFASNLESRGGCHRDDPSGADLYSVLFDPSTDKAERLTRLTRTPGQTEWFPSISPDRRYVAYMSARPSGGPFSPCDVRLLDLSTGIDVLLRADARFPAFSRDGKWLAFSTPFYVKRGVWVAPFGSSTTSPSTLGEPRLVMGSAEDQGAIEDPEFLPDGQRLVLQHRHVPSRGSGVSLVSIDGRRSVELTPENGSCHPTVRPDGGTVVFSIATSGRLGSVRRTDQGWASPSILPVPILANDYRPYDFRFGAVRAVHQSYPKWVANDRMLMTVHGSDRSGHFSFARLFLLEWSPSSSTPWLHDISGAVEALAGIKGRDYCTADAAEVSGPDL